jgi:catechol 2,3-dioxygenase-like lactoylglutathione lyase family enzyme
MPRLLSIDHVQFAIPVGCENAARRFFVELLGLTEVPKPTVLAARGGCWFRDGPVFVHCGISRDFTPATKAHIAFRVSEVDALATRLQAAGHRIDWDTDFPDEHRFYSSDPFGNRVEFIDAGAAQPDGRVDH